MNLIFDRTQADVTYAAELNRKLGRGEALTSQELADWNAGLKGAYNATDMNRVDAAVRELGGMLTAAGYPVEYKDPHTKKPEPQGSSEIALTSDDLQAGAYLYVSGEFRDGYANYVCTKSKIPLISGKSIVVRTDLELLQYSGFVWYDANKNFIANTYPSTSQGEAPIQWNGNFQAIPPENAAYCNININASAVTPADIGTVYVRQIANPESAGLPEGYTQVEYIESDGTQYIDTGYKPDNNTVLELTCALTSERTDWVGFYGARINPPGTSSTPPSSSFGLFYNDSMGVVQLDYGSSVTQYNTNGAIDNNGNEITIKMGQNALYVDTDLIATVPDQIFSSPLNLFICATNDDGLPAYFSGVRIFSCRIYEEDATIRFYIPCANSSGVAGLYDTVSGVFFRDAASGDVEPVELPDGYTQVEYIQSSGTQYIDTGVRPSHDSTVAIDAEVLASSQNYWGMFGARRDSSMQFWVFYNRTESSWCGRYSSNPNITINGAYAGRHRISLEKNVLKVDNSSSSTDASSFSSNYTSYIFACNNSGSAQYMCNIKLYSAEVFSGSQLVRDFVPCKNHSGVIGLYDLVSEKFYTNAGSGVFTAGAIVSEGFTHGDVIPRPPARDYWVVGDIISQTVWAQYIHNVKSARDAYCTMYDSPEIPAPTAPLTFDGANAIEKLLYDISQLYDAMVASYRPCGAFKCGNNAQHLPLQRSVT